MKSQPPHAKLIDAIEPGTPCDCPEILVPYETDFCSDGLGGVAGVGGASESGNASSVGSLFVTTVGCLESVSGTFSTKNQFRMPFILY